MKNKNIIQFLSILLLIVFSGCQKLDFKSYINTWDKNGPEKRREFLNNVFGGFSIEEKNYFVWDAFEKKEYPEVIEMIQSGASGDFEKPDAEVLNNPQPFIVFVLKAKETEVARALLSKNIALSKKKMVVVINGKVEYDDVAELVLKTYNPGLIRIVFDATPEFFSKQIDGFEPIFHIAGLDKHLDVKEELLNYFIQKSDKSLIKNIIDETEFIPDTINWDKMLDLFIAQCAKINERGSEGNTSLFLRCLSIISIDVGDTQKLNQRLNEIRLFIRHGADPTIKNEEGILPENFLDSWAAQIKIKKYSPEDLNKPKQFDPFYIEAQKKVVEILHNK